MIRPASDRSRHHSTGKGVSVDHGRPAASIPSATTILAGSGSPSGAAPPRTNRACRAPSPSPLSNSPLGHWGPGTPAGGRGQLFERRCISRLYIWSDTLTVGERHWNQPILRYNGTGKALCQLSGGLPFAPELLENSMLKPGKHTLCSAVSPSPCKLLSPSSRNSENACGTLFPRC